MANIVTGLFTSGFRLVQGEKLNTAFTQVNNVFAGKTQVTPSLSTTADALTATPSGTQSTSLLLTAGINRVATVASANDGVKLPPAIAGTTVVVINGAAVNSMQVFGTSPDTINDVATATGVAQAAGKSGIFSCPVAGKWYRNLSA